MILKGNLQTTAMGVMPHEDPFRAIELVKTLDIPFWPQLPKTDFFEDMYVQVSQGFPGIKPDSKNDRLGFNLDDFYLELEEYVLKWEENDFFRISPRYSPVYHRFLAEDWSRFHAIRGQTIGPISFGLKVTDDSKTPIIYHDEVKQVIYDFIAKKIKAQYLDLQQKNKNAFVWVDEPGLELIFMGFTGYASETAKKDYREFLQKLPGAKGVHLCGNPDWSFLFSLDLDIISADILKWGERFTRYKKEVKEFLQKGGIISWGITPTDTEEFNQHTITSLVKSLEELWNYLEQNGVSKDLIISQAWLAPARCCLINADKAQTVEKSFKLLREVSWFLKDKYGLT